MWLIHVSRAKCGAEDTQRHRQLECPATEACRVNADVGMLRALPIANGASFCVKCRIRRSRLLVCLFTDGSTYHVGTVPRSTCSVVLAEPCKLERAVFAKGQLPGLQTNYRAELCALLVAAQASTGGTMFVDAMSVVQGFQQLLDNGWRTSFWTKQKHADL